MDRIRTEERAYYNSISVSVSLSTSFSPSLLLSFNFLPISLLFCNVSFVGKKDYNIDLIIDFVDVLLKTCFPKRCECSTFYQTPLTYDCRCSFSLCQPLLSYSAIDSQQTSRRCNQTTTHLMPLPKGFLLTPSVGCLALMKAKLRSVMDLTFHHKSF